MTKDDIGKIINPPYPGVYAPTTAATKLIFKNGLEKVGYFQFTDKSPELEKENKFTFVELGESAQQYKATRDIKYVIVIDGNELSNVEYPSYTSELLGKLDNLKKQHEQREPTDWTLYKERWIESVNSLNSQIVYKWLISYETVIAFAFVPVVRDDAHIGPYAAMSLEMTLPDERTIVLEPISAFTTEYDGRLDLYMRGNIYKKVSVLRKILDADQIGWILARSNSFNDQQPFNKTSLEEIIFQWLQ